MLPKSPPHGSEHELSSYGPPPTSHPSGSSSSHPLLSQTYSLASPQPPSPKKKRPPSSTHASSRWWRPIILISLPITLILIYAVIHPHVPGLPALPKVVLQTGTETAVSPVPLSPQYSEDSDCTCGHTEEGERLCAIYHREALRSTRLVQGTGARVRRMLLAAREGKPLKVGILGGSGEFRMCGYSNSWTSIRLSWSSPESRLSSGRPRWARMLHVDPQSLGSEHLSRGERDLSLSKSDDAHSRRQTTSS